MFKKMVLCVTEATPKEVVEVATRLCSKQTKVYVLHVVRLLTETTKKEATKSFSPVMGAFKREGLNSELALVESTDVKNSIINFAKKNSCDVIVTGTIPKSGLVGYFSENVSDYIVQTAPCTVVLVRKPGKPG
ncbi:MAG: universal stress protein [Candidatus Hadarchaeota archaeon]